MAVRPAACVVGAGVRGDSKCIAFTDRAVLVPQLVFPSHLREAAVVVHVALRKLVVYVC